MTKRREPSESFVVGEETGVPLQPEQATEAIPKEGQVAKVMDAIINAGEKGATRIEEAAKDAGEEAVPVVEEAKAEIAELTEKAENVVENARDQEQKIFLEDILRKINNASKYTIIRLLFTDILTTEFATNYIKLDLNNRRAVTESLNDKNPEFKFFVQEIIAELENKGINNIDPEEDEGRKALEKIIEGVKTILKKRFEDSIQNIKIEKKVLSEITLESFDEEELGHLKELLSEGFKFSTQTDLESSTLWLLNTFAIKQPKADKIINFLLDIGLLYSPQEDEKLKTIFYNIDKNKKETLLQEIKKSLREEETPEETPEKGKFTDEEFANAAHLILTTQHGSSTMLQRRLKIGYNKATAIMQKLQELGIVGETKRANGSREVLISDRNFVRKSEEEEIKELLKQVSRGEKKITEVITKLDETPENMAEEEKPIIEDAIVLSEEPVEPVVADPDPEYLTLLNINPSTEVNKLTTEEQQELETLLDFLDDNSNDINEVHIKEIILKKYSRWINFLTYKGILNVTDEGKITIGTDKLETFLSEVEKINNTEEQIKRKTEQRMLKKWNKIMEIKDNSVLEKELTNFTNQYGNENIELLKDWTIARDTDTIEAYENFKEKYPNSNIATENAYNKITSKRQQERDEKIKIATGEMLERILRNDHCTFEMINNVQNDNNITRSILFQLQNLGIISFDTKNDGSIENIQLLVKNNANEENLKTMIEELLDKKTTVDELITRGFLIKKGAPNNPNTSANTKPKTNIFSKIGSVISKILPKKKTEAEEKPEFKYQNAFTKIDAEAKLKEKNLALTSAEERLRQAQGGLNKENIKTAKRRVERIKKEIKLIESGQVSYETNNQELIDIINAEIEKQEKLLPRSVTESQKTALRKKITNQILFEAQDELRKFNLDQSSWGMRNLVGKTERMLEKNKIAKIALNTICIGYASLFSAERLFGTEIKPDKIMEWVKDTTGLSLGDNATVNRLISRAGLATLVGTITTNPFFQGKTKELFENIRILLEKPGMKALAGVSGVGIIVALIVLGNPGTLALSGGVMAGNIFFRYATKGFKDWIMKEERTLLENGFRFDYDNLNSYITNTEQEIQKLVKINKTLDRTKFVADSMWGVMTGSVLIDVYNSDVNYHSDMKGAENAVTDETPNEIPTDNGTSTEAVDSLRLQQQAEILKRAQDSAAIAEANAMQGEIDSLNSQNPLTETADTTINPATPADTIENTTPATRDTVTAKVETAQDTLKTPTSNTRDTIPATSEPAPSPTPAEEPPATPKAEPAPTPKTEADPTPSTEEIARTSEARGIQKEATLVLGKDGVPKHLERTFLAISLDKMTPEYIGESLGNEEATKALNMAANLVKLAEGKSVAGISVEEFTKGASFDANTGTLNITNPAEFNKLLTKLENHADGLWDKGVLQGKGAAMAYIGNIKQEGWLNALHATGLEEEGIIGHDNINSINDFSKDSDVLKAREGMFDGVRAERVGDGSIVPAESITSIDNGVYTVDQLYDKSLKDFITLQDSNFGGIDDPRDLEYFKAIRAIAKQYQTWGVKIDGKDVEGMKIEDFVNRMVNLKEGKIIWADVSPSELMALGRTGILDQLRGGNIQVGKNLYNQTIDLLNKKQITIEEISRMQKIGDLSQKVDALMETQETIPTQIENNKLTFDNVYNNSAYKDLKMMSFRDFIKEYENNYDKRVLNTGDRGLFDKFVMEELDKAMQKYPKILIYLENKQIPMNESLTLLDKINNEGYEINIDQLLSEAPRVPTDEMTLDRFNQLKFYGITEQQTKDAFNAYQANLKNLFKTAEGKFDQSSWLKFKDKSAVDIIDDTKGSAPYQVELRTYLSKVIKATGIAPTKAILGNKAQTVEEYLTRMFANFSSKGVLKELELDNLQPANNYKENIIDEFNSPNPNDLSPANSGQSAPKTQAIPGGLKPANSGQPAPASPQNTPTDLGPANNSGQRAPTGQNNFGGLRPANGNKGGGVGGYTTGGSYNGRR